ncbi:MAG: adenylate/guanylate cyclase domain-containing protein [Saprospiraceae bacterium]|nr:adenylate/guanylate cyclase domain-containing protein [Saprospiraceae bacterium]
MNSFYLLAGLGMIVLLLIIWVSILRKQNQLLEKLIGHANEKLERLQTHFGRFTPEEVIEHLAAADGKYLAKMRNVTVLFADLKGFTKMCESMDPQQVVSILNGYFRAMSEALASHHGQVTELMGDGILALFGALSSNPWQAQDAVLGAIAMRKSLEKYNEELKSRSLPQLSFGIGIHQGEVLAGVMGNAELSKFGVVGDTINVAARVEAMTRLHNCDLLITEEVREGLDERFSIDKMPPLAVKGKGKPIVTYYVHDFDPIIDRGKERHSVS